MSVIGLSADEMASSGLYQFPAKMLNKWRELGSLCRPDSPLAAVISSFEKIDAVYFYSVPLRHRFRGIDVREGLVFKSREKLTEFAPFWDYGAVESTRWLHSALVDLCLENTHLYRSTVPVNVTIPVVSPEKAYELVINSGGCGTAKVKVADPRSTLDDDQVRIMAVRQALVETTGQAQIRIDVNGLWDINEAASAINTLDNAAEGLQYVEQPCETVAELAELKQKISAPIAVDELIRRALNPLQNNPLEAIPEGLADVAVIKLQPLGGAERLQALAYSAAQRGMKVVVSSALDSAVGLSQGLRAAASLPELPYACGLATGQLMTIQIASNMPTIEKGELPVFTPTLLPPISEPNELSQARIKAWNQRVTEILELATKTPLNQQERPS